MSEMAWFVLARAIHVVSIVVWIGGVSFVTLVLLPSLKHFDEPAKRMHIFETVEHRFSLYAKITTLLAGISGFYMVHVLQAWSRFIDVNYWWMHAMVLVWFLFSVVLFILEPLFLHRWFHQRASEKPEATFALVLRMHRLLLALSILAIVGAVAGMRGYLRIV